MCILALLAVSFMTSGCVPFQIPQSPAATGVILDAETQAPVAKARVCFREVPDSQTLSDSSGYFDIKPKYRKRWLPALPYDFFPPHGTMVIEASGYQTFVFDQQTQSWPPYSKDRKGGFVWRISKLANQAPVTTATSLVFGAGKAQIFFPLEAAEGKVSMWCEEGVPPSTGSHFESGKTDLHVQWEDKKDRLRKLVCIWNIYYLPEGRMVLGAERKAETITFTLSREDERVPFLKSESFPIETCRKQL